MYANGSPVPVSVQAAVLIDHATMLTGDLDLSGNANDTIAVLMAANSALHSACDLLTRQGQGMSADLNASTELIQQLKSKLSQPTSSVTGVDSPTSILSVVQGNTPLFDDQNAAATNND